MLVLKIPARQVWDPNREEFLYIRETTLRLEHSLLSLAKWESKWHIPFFSSSGSMSREQQLDYLRCMTLDKGVDPKVYQFLTREQLNAINTYMDEPMTATWFHGEPKPNEPRDPAKRPRQKAPPRRSGTVTTAEVLYCQMFQLGISKECEKWHLNRLLTLLRVCSEAQTPPKKMSRGEAMAQQRALNAQRKAKLHTRG